MLVSREHTDKTLGTPGTNQLLDGGIWILLPHTDKEILFIKDIDERWKRKSVKGYISEGQQQVTNL